MQVGYFAMAGVRASATHIVGKDENPICGSRLGNGMRFHFCGHVETALLFVECIKCRATMKKLAAEIAAM